VSAETVRHRISEKTMLQERCPGCGKVLWFEDSRCKEGGYWARCRDEDCQTCLKILQTQYPGDVTTLHGLQGVSCPKCGATNGFLQECATNPQIYEDIPRVLHVKCKAKQCLCLAFNGIVYERGDFTRTADQTCFGKASTNLDVVKVKFHNNSGKRQHKVKHD
jgi:hypothetical protein